IVLESELAVPPLSPNGLLRADRCQRTAERRPAKALSRIAQLDQRPALPDQCLHSAEADVRPPRRKSGFDPERTLIAEERPRQRGSEYGLRAGDSELNRCHIRRAKVGSRQLPGPIALRKGDGENARPLLRRTTRKRSLQLRPRSHSGPSSNDSFNQPAISGPPVTSSGTLP